jgi:phage FluMu protein Com
VDRDFSEELTSLMPVVPHGIAGVNCSGVVVAAVEDSDVELRCSKCGAVLGVVQVGIMEGLLGLDCATAECPHCGKLNTFPGSSEVSTYTCDGCGKVIEIEEGG